MDDPLSDIFHLIRLKSAVYFERNFHAPWGMHIAGTGFAQFHAVTRGNCVVETGGREHECSVGDVLLFPRGAPHTLSDLPGRNAVPGSEVMASLATDDPMFSNGETYTRLICGHYEFRSDLRHPMFDELPEFIHLRSLNLPRDERVSSTLALLMGELNQPAAGFRSIVERYAEILIAQVFRILAAREVEGSGFFKILADERLSRALGRMHREYAEAINLDDLAAEAALSKSGFALRFKETTGVAPIEYLSKWRMLQAGDLLASTNLSVANVAEKVGYQSDIAFARAFKREFGKTPSQHRAGA
ncbi:MAG: AraC family transcriptional regulator [Alphaproteobacteria bacterium]|nr:AraC family transcriptional regulator [Alphaproteobacteria bacterium]